MARSACCFWMLVLLLNCVGVESGAHTAGRTCTARNLDFVVMDGNAAHAAVEDDIRAELAKLNMTVSRRFLTKADFNNAMTSGEFHMVFSETWGAPYDPVSYITGWMGNNEAHYSAMSGVTGANSRTNIFAKVNLALAKEKVSERSALWAEVHNMVHQTAINLPLWGQRIPSVLNRRLGGYSIGYQQFDYPVHRIVVQSGSKTVTIAPGAQTGLFKSVGRLDPHSYRPNEFFSNNWVYEGLTSYGSDGAILPALAASWVESGTSITFTLRTGVKFHDGQDWNCAAAKLNFDHVLATPLTTSDYHLWYKLPGVLKSWTCDANDRLVLTTNAPYHNLLQELTFIRPLRMLSPASFQSTASNSWQTQNSCPTGWGKVKLGNTEITCAGIKAPIGTGPFKYISRVTDANGADTEVVFHQHTSYWGGVPDIAILKIKHYASSSAVKAALLDGSLDMVAGAGVLAPADLKSFFTTNAANFYTYQTPVMMHQVVILNSGKAPTNDFAVRKAIIHGVDKASIIQKEMAGNGEAVDRLFPQTAPYSRVELTPRWDYDSEKAVMLNCPLNPPAPVQVPVAVPVPVPSPVQVPVPVPAPAPDNSDEKTTLGLALGLGLGLPLLLACGGAAIFYSRAQQSQKELKQALSRANVSPTNVGQV